MTTETRTTTAAIYARVSRDSTGQGKSVEQQIAECTKTCVHEGWEIADIVTDNSISASRYEARQRPGYESLTRILKPGMVLVVWEFSRAGRRTQEHLALQELCEERSVLFQAGTKQYDIRKPEDRFMGTIESAIAAKSSDETRERVLRAKRADADAGRPNGSLGFGFMPTIDPTTHEKAWVLDPMTAPLVKEAATAILAGASLHSIVKDWNQRGIKTFKGNDWQSQTLRQLLLRPAIAGLRQHQGQTTTVKAVWPPIITEQQHRAIVATFADPSRITQRGSEVKHLLTNIALCGKCCKPVVRMSPNAKLQRGSRYACIDRHVGRSQAEVDRHVVSELMRIMDDRLADEFLMDETGAADGMDSPSEHHLTKAAELRQQLDDATAEFIAGRLTAATLGRIEAALLPQIDQERRSADERTSNPLLAKLAAGAKGAWKAADISERRAMLRAAVVVTIHPVGKGGTHVFDPNGVTVERRR